MAVSKGIIMTTFLKGLMERIDEKYLTKWFRKESPTRYVYVL